MANHVKAGDTTGKDVHPEKRGGIAPGEITDVLTPPEMMSSTIEAAVAKSNYSALLIFVKSFLCTGFLGYATAFSFLAVAQGMPQFVSGLLFPVGYVMVAILGLEMATGNFSVMGMGVVAGRIRVGELLNNWGLTLLGNLIGGVVFAAILWIVITRAGNTAGGGLLGAQLMKVAEHKVAYKELGGTGLLVAFASGILCNWLVSLGPIISLASRSIVGKVVVLWLPFSVFFALGFEHAIVNMFLLPMGIMLGGNYSVADWWMWNQIPVTLGNITAALVFNSGLLYFASKPKIARLTPEGAGGEYKTG
ncbi:MAG: formate and nitrite transporter [Deltaproteobacteria bacterium CG2_30_66_27]|nr:MAG: formate and nitrite transporter [Deltaproteobacteria bacterium CG2_30_66_27]PJB33493.1 MAG: formate and nitrite transporter [Deltaproteobacteria bacterium CG_4_9_14_3_um_filter_65_9]